MKYITTDKHPELKEGRIIDADYPAYFIVDGNRIFKDDIKDGFIKELQEPEFTKDDMMNFAIYHRDFGLVVNDTLDEWINCKNND